MKWFGPRVHFEIFDRKDELQVLITRQRRWLDFLVEAFVIAGLAFLFWRYQSWVVLVMLVIALGHGVVDRLGDDHAELLITKEGIKVFGSLGRISSTDVHLRWSSISGLDYREGGEDDDETSGLLCAIGWLEFDAAHDSRKQRAIGRDNRCDLSAVSLCGDG